MLQSFEFSGCQTTPKRLSGPRAAPIRSASPQGGRRRRRPDGRRDRSRAARWERSEGHQFGLLIGEPDVLLDLVDRRTRPRHAPSPLTTTGPNRPPGHPGAATSNATGSTSARKAQPMQFGRYASERSSRSPPSVPGNRRARTDVVRAPSSSSGWLNCRYVVPSDARQAPGPRRSVSRNG